MAFDQNKSLKLTVDSSKVDEDLTDFPVLIVLSSGTGITGYDATAVFDELYIDANDGFTGVDGSYPDFNRWTTTDASNKLSIQNNRLEFDSQEVLDTTSSVDANWNLSGDFDIQFDAEELNGSDPTGTSNHEIRFHIGNSEFSYLFIRVSRGSTGKNFNTNGILTTSDTIVRSIDSTKLRITRSGSTFKAYYWIGSQWEWDGNTSGKTFVESSSSDITTIQIYFKQEGDGATRWYASADNFQINSGTVLWPSHPYRKKIAITTTVSDVETQLPVEIESWDSLNEKAYLWTKVPTVYSGIDTELTFYYDSTMSGTMEYDNYSYYGTSNVNLSNQRETCIYMSPDGTKMYTSGSYADVVYEYTLSTPFDISTCTYVTNKDVGSQDTIVYGIAWSDDGTKMFVAGNETDRIFQYTASTPWSVASVSYVNYLSVTAGQQVSFGDSGRKMCVRNNVYTLSTPWDVTTASLDGSVGTRLYFSADGHALFNLTGLNITRYYLSTPFDISTITYEGVLFSISGQVSLCYGYCVANNDADIYIVNSDESTYDGVYRYSGELVNKYVGDTGEYAAKKVWDSNFVGVWHMAQDPSGGSDSILDSTFYTNHGTPGGSMTSDNLIDTDYGKAIDFDGVDDYISVTDNSSLRGMDSLTIESVINIDTKGKYERLIDYADETAPNTDRKYRILFDEAANQSLRFIAWDDIDDIIGTVASVNFPTTSWRYYAGAYDGTSSIISQYDDMAADTSSGTGNAISNVVNGNLWIGAEQNGYPNHQLDGKVAELRISKTYRTDSWRNATYYTSFNNLITFGQYLSFYFSDPSPTQSGVSYGYRHLLSAVATISGGTGSYFYDTIFYADNDVQIGSTVSGTSSGLRAISNDYLMTPVASGYSWYVIVSSSGTNATSPVYYFDSKFLCGGNTFIEDTPISGVPVRLYKRNDGSFIGEDISSGVSGIFQIPTDYTGFHYAIALHPSSESYNAQIYDWLLPTTS